MYNKINVESENFVDDIFTPKSPFLYSLKLNLDTNEFVLVREYEHQEIFNLNGLYPVFARLSFEVLMFQKSVDNLIKFLVHSTNAKVILVRNQKDTTDGCMCLIFLTENKLDMLNPIWELFCNEISKSNQNISKYKISTGLPNVLYFYRIHKPIYEYFGDVLQFSLNSYLALKHVNIRETIYRKKFIFYLTTRLSMKFVEQNYDDIVDYLVSNNSDNLLRQVNDENQLLAETAIDSMRNTVLFESTDWIVKEFFPG